MRPRTWTALFGLAFAGWIGLNGMITQASDAPAVETYTPVTLVRTDPRAATTDLIAPQLHDYLAELTPHWRGIQDVAALSSLITNGALVLDVRDADLYALGHIPGAINIPLADLGQHLNLFALDQLIIVHCGNGLRSAYAAAALDLLGFSNVYDFLPGFAAWVAAGEPVSMAPSVAPALPAAPQLDTNVQASLDQFFATLPADAYGVLQPAALERLIMERDALVIDLREPTAFAAGRIPGSLNIPLAELGNSLDQLPFDRPVVLSCPPDANCGAAAPALHMLGYANVRVFPPSFAGWQAANLLIER